MLKMAKKNTPHQFSDSFEIVIINSLIKKKFEPNFIIFKALFGVAETKQNKILLLLLLKKFLGPLRGHTDLKGKKKRKIQ